MFCGESLDWENIEAGLPVQARGFWSWDVFPQLLSPEAQDERLWKDQATRRTLLTETNEPVYFQTLEKRLCIITDASGMSATLQVKIKKILGKYCSAHGFYL